MSNKSVFAKLVAAMVNKLILEKIHYYAVKNSQKVDVYSYLKNLNLQTIFDIGAHKGEFSIELAKIHRQAQYFLFEPIKHNNTKFPKSFTIFEELLSQLDGMEADFYSNETTGDSIHKELTEFYSHVEPKKIKTRSLDSLVLEHNLPQPNLIKLDVQGAEVSVINGGKKCFSKSLYVLTEMSISETNLGGCKMEEVISALKNLGFHPIHLTEIHYNAEKVISQLDMLFVNESINV